MLLKRMKKRLKQKLAFGNARLERKLDKQLMLIAHSQCNVNRSITRISDFRDIEFSAFSQWGEDGIIDWLLSQMPKVPNIFIEFGVENYHEANTRLLLQLRNWGGLVIDGSAENIQEIKEQDIYWRHCITAKSAFIDRDNINTLLEESGVVGEIGLLSIDIDGNDYWVWQAIEVVSPAMVIVEYNAVLGDKYPLSVPYAKDFERSKAHHSNLYFGASIAAMIDLGERKGYTFVGTTSSGVNAFFIKNSLINNVKDKIDNYNSFPSKHRESRTKKGVLNFASGVSRLEVIKELPLVNVQSMELTSLAEMDDVYSKTWKDLLDSQGE